MNDNQRLWTGWIFVGAPLTFHTLYELAGKTWLLGIPEFVVDLVCGGLMLAGLFLVSGRVLRRIVTRVRR